MQSKPFKQDFQDTTWLYSNFTMIQPKCSLWVPHTLLLLLLSSTFALVIPKAQNLLSEDLCMTSLSWYTFLFIASYASSNPQYKSVIPPPSFFSLFILTLILFQGDC